MKLKIKPFNKDIHKMYENHNHFHPGDSGLDIYIIENQIINPNFADFANLSFLNLMHVKTM